jgi:predicted DNA-binding transcriptional regulator AlpA
MSSQTTALMVRWMTEADMEKHSAATVAPVGHVADQPLDYEPWMSAQEIAAMFGKSVRTILRWADDDPDFPESFPAGPRDRRWKRSEILAYRKIVEGRRKPLSRKEKRAAQLAAAEQRRLGN